MVQYHLVSVASTQEMRKLACLIGEHCVMSVIYSDHDVVLFWKWFLIWLGVSFWLFLRGSDPLSLTFHVTVLGLLGFGEVFVNILDIY